VALPDDVELMAVTYLTAQLPTMYVSSETPEPDVFDSLMAAKDAIVTVVRVGGDPSLRSWAAKTVIDAPRLSVDVRAKDRGAANTATALVRKAAETMHGVSAAGCKCTSIDVGGPTIRPDEPNTGVVRVGFFADMQAKAAPV
jgi:hypothetical protein